MTRHSPLQQIKEAKQIARDHGLRVVEYQAAPGQTSFAVYRQLPDGTSTRIGSRSTPAGIRRFVAQCAGFR